MAHRILGDELQEGWLTEVVATLEIDTLSREAWRIREQATQSVHIAVVEQIDSLPKSPIGDPLVLRQLKARRILLADKCAQACPARESILPSDGQLAIAQDERRGPDRGV
jgi:hypothetical protein